MTAYVPPSGSADLKAFWRAIVGLASGRSNAVGTVTLTPGATSTTVVDQNCSQGSTVNLSPSTPNAAAAIPTTCIPPATITNGSFVIQHANAATSDRTFDYSIQG